MDCTLSGAGEPSTNVEHPVEPGSGWDLTDASFIDTFEEDAAGGYRVTYDSGQVTPSVAIIAVVSNITGRDPLALDPLFESIDFNAVDALFTENSASGSRLTFQYSGYEITIDADDSIAVVPR